MADIAMCRPIICPHKEDCYRYTAEASENWQSYFGKPPINEVEEGKCDYYWGKNGEKVWTKKKIDENTTTR